MAWKLAQCGWAATERLDSYLAEGWEPFAVTETEDGATVWLRRSADPQDAHVTMRPRVRSGHEAK